MNYDTQNVTQSDTQSDTQNDTRNLKPNDRRKKIIEVMKEDEKITSLELSNMLYVSVSTIKRDLKILTEEKTIEYVGSAKNGYWKVN